MISVLTNVHAQIQNFTSGIIQAGLTEKKSDNVLFDFPGVCGVQLIPGDPIADSY